MRSLRFVLPSALLLVSTGAFAATHVVSVQDNQFTPSSVTICIGDTVQWNWTGINIHTVTSGDDCSPNGAWDSGMHGNGFTFSQTFATIPPECGTDSSVGDNTCNYTCLMHCPTMDGLITITEGTASGDNALATNKLRIAHDPTQGRGGTIKGAEVLDGVTFSDIEPNSTSLKLTLDAPGLGGPISDTVDLDDVRGGFQGTFATNDADDVTIGTVKIVPLDATTAKLLVKYETNNFNVGAVGPITATVEITHSADVGGSCGAFTFTVSGDGIVSF